MSLTTVQGRKRCRCTVARHDTRLVAVTGGPGSGKTAILELARHRFCSHVRVLPEVATMLFAGGFPRLDTLEASEAAQRAIAAVQRELERVARDDHTALAVCDRGTVDGLAYWPGDEQEYWRALGTTRDAELARYYGVIHLHTPSDEDYDHSNPLRTESFERARLLDDKIARAWRGHPHVHFVESSADFLDKAARALAVIEEEIPSCCALPKPGPRPT